MLKTPVALILESLKLSKVIFDYRIDEITEHSLMIYVKKTENVEFIQMNLSQIIRNE